MRSAKVGEAVLHESTYFHDGTAIDDELIPFEYEGAWE